ncbi:G2/M phase-specific E3 ubiquitin-protein ligase-like [Engraulis encrasicolus]|uniref:G2/M phase-specific E3 ubiquitin-protein ligase-like n=1 Tax=Engraulis encrasicolus TaxID=184585 RepID=UPI002FD1CF4D
MAQLFTYNVAEFVPFYMEEDDALQEAIQRSLQEDDGPDVDILRSSEMLTAEEIQGRLAAHSDRVITPGKRHINISRASVWTTALQAFKRPSFAEGCDMLSVTFASDEHAEDAADLGGPRREFFRLLVKAILQDSGAFEGTPNGCMPRLNILHLQNGVYKIIGRMMSTIIVQGGEPPAFLSPSVVDYIVHGDILQLRVTPDDISDFVIRENLNKVLHATSHDELEEAISSCDWRFQMEGLPAQVTMDNRDAFVRNAVLYHTVLRRQSCIDQLTDGLSHYGVLKLVRENPSMCVLLQKGQENDLTAAAVSGIMKPSYSVPGSNRRRLEELLVVKFREFLNCVENKNLRETFDEGRKITVEEEDFLGALSPGHILAYATGSSRVPAIGFRPSPKLVFVHDGGKNLPVAHTCANELLLFVNTKMIAANDEFNYHFLTALMNGAVFSTI